MRLNFFKDAPAPKSAVLLIYTGGTIGMKEDPVDGALRPFDFDSLLDEVPELRKFALRIDHYTFSPLIDSSDVEPSMWQAIAGIIRERYDDYDGFVILHGTDTMAYSASAMSFMFDHLDKPSVMLLHANNPRMKLFCGLGVGQLIKSWCPAMEVIEAGWYQQLNDGQLKITFLPAQHWSKRSLNDGGQRLWGAFMLEGDGLSVYYGGDTGYSNHFAEIPELFGVPDYALLGIGAYKPRWFMQPNHISPYDSLTASEEMQARVTIPMHYGTFDLSDEPLSDPPSVFAEEARKRNVRVMIPALGEIVTLKEANKQ